MRRRRRRSRSHRYRRIRRSISDRVGGLASRHGRGVRATRDRTRRCRQRLRGPSTRGSAGAGVSLVAGRAAPAGIRRHARRRSGGGGAQLLGGARADGQRRRRRRRHGRRRECGRRREGGCGQGRRGAPRAHAGPAARAHPGGRSGGASRAIPCDRGARRHAREPARLRTAAAGSAAGCRGGRAIGGSRAPSRIGAGRPAASRV